MSLRDLVALYDIYDVLRLDRSKKVHICPFPQHAHGARPTPSLSIDVRDDGTQRFKCFGTCGLSGSVIDAVGYLGIPGYDPMNDLYLSMAASKLTNGFEPTDEPIRRAERVPIDPLLWKEFYPAGPGVIEYAEGRGLNQETLERFKIGEKNGAMAIPAFEHHLLAGIKYRATWPNPNVRFWAEKNSRTALFNFDRVAWKDDPLLVVKGEIPVMLLDQMGFAACCPTTGETVWDMSQWRPLLSFSDLVVVVGDNDHNPKTRERMQASVAQRAESLHAKLTFPPENYKDIDEYILAEPEAAVEEIKRWLSFGR